MWTLRSKRCGVCSPSYSLCSEHQRAQTVAVCISLLREAEKLLSRLYLSSNKVISFPVRFVLDVCFVVVLRLDLMYPRLSSISLHIAEDDLDSLLLPVPPKHCDHRFMPPSPTQWIMTTSLKNDSYSWYSCFNPYPLVILLVLKFYNFKYSHNGVIGYCICICAKGRDYAELCPSWKSRGSHLLVSKIHCAYRAELW